MRRTTIPEFLIPNFSFYSTSIASAWSLFWMESSSAAEIGELDGISQRSDLADIDIDALRDAHIHDAVDAAGLRR